MAETRIVERRRGRQCGLGWHYECSDPFGESCECECHPWILRNDPDALVVERVDGEWPEWAWRFIQDERHSGRLDTLQFLDALAASGEDTDG